MEKQRLFFLFLVVLSMAGCGGNNDRQQDTVSSGTIHISVDETYQPLIDSELRVFQSLYPKAHIIAHYKPEADCFRDLLNDSARMVIASRDLLPPEKQYFHEVKITPRSLLLAWDAIALIAHPTSKDTSLTIAELKAIMNGRYTKNKIQLVFDNERSSTIRYLVDSINGGKPITGTSLSTNGSAAVVDYVATHPNAIGAIGVSWIGDPADSTSMSFLSRVKVIGLKNEGNIDYLKPYQAYIGIRSQEIRTGKVVEGGEGKGYALTRGLFFVLREPYSGLGTGFATFLGSNEGQLVISKFRMVPAHLNIVIREAKIE